MNTITFTPHSDLDELGLEFRAKWVEALMTSAQHKERLSNFDDSAHCCLGVAARLEGATKKDYKSHSLPYSHYAPIATNAHTLRAAMAEGACYYFSELNDQYLTHRQIAELLKGNTVTIEVKS